MTQTEINNLAYQIVGGCIEVHKELGPGLLEEIYEEALCIELRLQGFNVERQQQVPVYFKGHKCKNNLRLDILIEDLIIVECKAVDVLHPIFDAKLLTYMKLSEKPKGLLVNFNVLNIVKEGLKPFVNEYFRELSKS